MPSLIGAFSSVIAAYAAFKPELNVDHYSSGRTQALYQLLFIGITLGIGITSGILTGLAVRKSFFEPSNPKLLFQDEEYFEVPELEIPYFFDHRGEISREREQNAHHDEIDQKPQKNDPLVEAALTTRLLTLENKFNTLNFNVQRGSTRNLFGGSFSGGTFANPNIPPPTRPAALSESGGSGGHVNYIKLDAVLDRMLSNKNL